MAQSGFGGVDLLIGKLWLRAVGGDLLEGLFPDGCRGPPEEVGWVPLLHIKVRLPVLLCAVKTVEGDFRFCWTTTPNVGQTHKENPNLVRIL